MTHSGQRRRAAGRIRCAHSEGPARADWRTARGQTPWRRVPSGFPVTGIGSHDRTISSGSAASGRFRLGVRSGWRAAGCATMPGGTAHSDSGVAARGPADAVNSVAATNHVVLRPTGPPPDQPANAPGAAPGPDFFFVPGNYVPDGDQVTWTPGFWARQQPGWDWIPAHWVRRPDAWEFRAGYWVRDPGATDLNAGIGRKSTAQSRAAGLSSRDRRVDPGRARFRFRRGPSASRPGAENARDPIAEAEAAERDPYELRRVLVVPGIGMPYYVIRPPGSYPYGPGGVVVPGAVPPFVRRMLDRVLP